MIVEITYFRPDGGAETTITRWPADAPSLAEEMLGYTADLQPGGKFAYVSEYLGYEPKPAFARLLSSGSVVEEWKA